MDKEKILCFLTGLADVVLCNSHFSWGQHRTLPSSSQGVDDITDDVTRPWTLFNISLTVQPVSDSRTCKT